MSKIKIGVFGAYRGMAMIDFCAKHPSVTLVAICDKNEAALKKAKKLLDETGCKSNLYSDFKDFFNENMDAVVLANYATEHAPYAIRFLNSGRHVISEVLPAQNMAQAVALCDAVEKSGKIYAYAENYCYFPATNELFRLYREGRFGEFEYGEGEYVHDCTGIWPAITYGDPEHWRNNMHANYYCTHSTGPLLHITKLRPKSVVGLELPPAKRLMDLGGKCGAGALELITLENGAVIKSLHSLALKREPHAIWYSLYGEKGMGESSRLEDGVNKITTYLAGKFETYVPKPFVDENITKHFSKGHFGGDFYPMYYFIHKILGDDAGENSIDVYEALDMWLPGHFAYRSVCNGNASFKIPDMRNPSERAAFKNDTWCTNPKIANGDLAPVYSKGTPDIPMEVYERVRKMYLEEQEKQQG